MKRKVLSSLLVVVYVAGLSTGIFGSSAQAATLNPNLIMDDAVFDNYNSMSASQIDSFLNSFPSSCISPNSTFLAIDPVGYNPTDSFLYGGNVTAGTVIAHAAQAYNINPQVLLTTLQKEQSLVNGSAGCGINRYAKAMGYACPDATGSYSYSGLNLYTKNGVNVTATDGAICVKKLVNGAYQPNPGAVGFTQQVIRAAWMLKYSEQRARGNIGWAIIKGNWNNSDDLNATYSGYMTPGCFKRSKYESTCTNFDGYATIDGTSVQMQSGATAALYRYTPHFSGNQSFLNLFTGWFGNTTGPEYNASFSTAQLFSDQARTHPLPIVSEGRYILEPEQTAYAAVVATNIGRASWDSSTHLGTSFPRDRSSFFATDSWINYQRPASMDVATLGYGGSASFIFPVHAPSQMGDYNESFSVVEDGKTWMDASISLKIDVTVPDTSNTTTDTILDSSNPKKNEQTIYSNPALSPDGYSSLALSNEGYLSLRNEFSQVWGVGGAGTGSKLIMQSDGNLVLYTKDGRPVWATNTEGRGDSILRLQPDGNMVLYNQSGPTWSSGTGYSLSHFNYTYDKMNNESYLFAGQSVRPAGRNHYLIMQSDGNLVLYTKDGRPVWATSTEGRGATVLRMQSDGNLVLYTKDGRPVWATSTNGR